jgi:hypothetical protein
MQTLTNSNKDLLDNLLRKLKFEERLSLVWRDGESDIRESLYSFEEVVDFLGMDINRLAGRTGIPSSVDFDALIDWLKDIIKDNELAGAISELRQQNYDPAYSHERELIASARELMSSRLSQCRQLQRETTIVT